MERELQMQLDFPIGMPTLNDGIPSPTLSDFLLRSSFPTQNESIIGFPSSSSLGGSFKGHIHADKTVIYNGNFHELCFPLPQEVPSEMFSSNFSYASSSLVPNSLNCGYDGILSDTADTKSYQNRFLMMQVKNQQNAQYLTALKQILSSFSLEGVDHTSYSSAFVGSSSKVTIPSNQFNGEARKSQLLSLLELVDDCYSRCLDEIHTVISAFHAVTELDPQLHSYFTLRTLSFFYKSLRDRISNEILVDVRSIKDSNFEKSFIQKQWIVRKDQHVWRPQRGLPEQSISILRAWMFENFLHPYPKDSEKHLLALKSGLTRSQVSNWFINARVRIWKPLVEEMCSELNRRKEVTRKESNNHGQTHSSMYEHNRRFNT